MIYVNVPQGTPEWLSTRVAVITASRCKDACDRLKNGAPSQKAIGYAAQVAMERVAGIPCDDTFVNFAMKRGSELEPQAREAYETETGRLAEESGIYLTDDRLFGYSSDGTIGADGLLEIKCPLSPLTVISMWRDGDLSDYMHQIQMGMWLTGRKWLDFVMFDPRLAPIGKTLYIQHVKRDEAFIERMEADLMAFNKMVGDYERVLHLRHSSATAMLKGEL